MEGRGAVGLPEQHEDQLQLGFRMIQNAFNSKVQSLEQEVRGLRLTCEEQKNSLSSQQKKNSTLEMELVESHQRSQQLAEENKELFKTVNQLRKQLSRLEGLKKMVMQSVQDHQNGEAEHEDSKLYMRDDYLKGALPLTHSAEQGSDIHAAPYPRAVSPAPQSAGARAVSPPHGYAGAAPAFNAPVDGKAFFRKARNSLSYEAFNEFLGNIKLLNNQQQTREETLERAIRIFGPEQRQLYQEFEQLLVRSPSL